MYIIHAHLGGGCRRNWSETKSKESLVFHIIIIVYIHVYFACDCVALAVRSLVAMVTGILQGVWRSVPQDRS